MLRTASTGTPSVSEIALLTRMETNAKLASRGQASHQSLTLAQTAQFIPAFVARLPIALIATSTPLAPQRFRPASNVIASSLSQVTAQLGLWSRDAPGTPHTALLSAFAIPQAT